MRCPYCRTPTVEGTPECLRCGFSLTKVSQMFGTPPKLQEQVSDMASLFTPGDRKKLCVKISEFEKKFPQTKVDFLTTVLEPGVDLRTYCYWIFNASQSGPIQMQIDDTGGHHILFTIDAGNGKANCMIGYGLQPFVSDEQLETILAEGVADLVARKFLTGSIQLLDALEKLLIEIHSNLGRVYGIEVEESYQSS